MKKYDIYNDRGVVIQKEKRYGTRKESEHTHDFIELVYTLKGNCTHYINGKPYVVGRGDLLFINYGEIHSFTVDSESAEFYNFLVKPEFISENIVNSDTINDIFLIFLPEGSSELQSRKTSCVRFVGQDRVEIEHVAENMYIESQGDKPCAKLILNAYMRLIFAKLIRSLLQEAGTERPNILTEDILQYIDKNFTSPVTAATLADHCFYNPAYLGRIFKAVYGKSMKEYIREKRMQYAMDLLRNTQLSIEEICARVGYNGKTQFYKNFKSYYGTSPGEFRK